MDTVPVSREPPVGAITATVPVGEACATEAVAAVGEVRGVLEATGVEEALDTGNTVKSDAMAVAVGTTMPQSSASSSSFEEESNEKSVADTLTSLTVPSEQV